MRLPETRVHNSGLHTCCKAGKFCIVTNGIHSLPNGRVQHGCVGGWANWCSELRKWVLLFCTTKAVPQRRQSWVFLGSGCINFWKLLQSFGNTWISCFLTEVYCPFVNGCLIQKNTCGTLSDLKQVINESRSQVKLKGPAGERNNLPSASSSA